MDLAPDLRIIHEPVRLQIMGLLYRHPDLGFTAVKTALGITGGNLASHASRLQEAGLIEVRDTLTRNGFEKRYQITREGLQRFERYLAALADFLAASRMLPSERTNGTGSPQASGESPGFAG